MAGWHFGIGTVADDGLEPGRSNGRDIFDIDLRRDRVGRADLSNIHGGPFSWS